MLSIGIASTGVLTLAYFAIASHLLKGRGEYSHLDVLWSVMFVIISVIYRPIEQLLSRTIADHHARGIAALPLRVPMTIQGAFAIAFLAVALPLHGELADHVFASDTLYWIFVVGIVAYAASYFARGAYWPALGNTPGHLNHWSRRSFARLLSHHGEVVELRSPFPWTMLLVRL